MCPRCFHHTRRIISRGQVEKCARTITGHCQHHYYFTVRSVTHGRNYRSEFQGVLKLRISHRPRGVSPPLKSYSFKDFFKTIFYSVQKNPMTFTHLTKTFFFFISVFNLNYQKQIRILNYLLYLSRSIFKTDKSAVDHCPHT